jgi:putative transposase
MDESGFSLNYPLSKCWMRSGTQKRLPAHTQVRSGCLLAGVIDWMSSQVWCQPIPKLTSDCLMPFFEWLFVEVYPTEKLVLVLDNASSHHAKPMQAFLSLFEHRVIVIWLPTYSPDMNLIERFWKHLKQRVTANHLFADVQTMTLALQTELASQNRLDCQSRFSLSNH